MAEILHKALSYQVVGAAMEVHKVLGPGFLEKVYESALAHELSLRGIRVDSQRPLEVVYKGQVVGEYVADMVVEDSLILELKAVHELGEAHIAQAIHYLAATGFELAILLNFGASRLQFKRAVRYNNANTASNADHLNC